jgi:hypothetical protein
MRYLIVLLWLYAHAAAAQQHPADTLGIQYEYKEVPVYEQHDDFAGQTVLRMNYSDHHILNARHWVLDPREKQIYAVDLVFTNYPKNKAEWRVGYGNLLRARIREVQQLIPELKNNKEVKWNLILQTECPKAEVAKAMFHGAVVKYKLVLNTKLKTTLSSIKNIIGGKEPFGDSVVFKVFERNQGWTKMLVVNDWTGSMYAYGAQAVRWHRLHLKQPRVGNFVFFNDGNMLPDDEKKIGSTGGMFEVKADSLPPILQTMREVMLSGYGGDEPENDLEALLYAIQKTPDFEQLVLIADNKSAVRDMALLPQIKVPVRIILCGTKKDGGVHPDYLEIARATGGSIHTIEEDIALLSEAASKGEPIEVMGKYYFWQDGAWKLLDAKP